jgi:dTDP-4-dehydrorhamnose 3,5-epimerase
MIEDVATAPLNLNGHLRGNTIALNPGFSQMKDAETFLEEIYAGGVPEWFSSADFTALAVLRGAVRIVLFDARQKSDTFGAIEVHYFNNRQSQWLLVPPGVYYAWQVISGSEAFVCRVSNQLPEPVPRSETQIIPFQWT